MNGMDLIKARRSVRKFKPDPIPEQVVNEILEAAVWSPSHRNSQPWEFAVIGPQTRSRLNQLYRTVMEASVLSNPDLPAPARQGILSLMEDFGGAPYMVAVLSRPPQDHLETVENPITAGVAAQNMSLAAWDQGVGSVWLSIGGNPAAREILQVKTGYQVVAVLAMGYPAMVPPAPPRESYKNRISSLP
jgi:nitroreductase